MGTAAAAAYRHEGREPGTKPSFRYVTASLQVDYIKPTPLGPTIEIRASVEEIKGRKTIVTATVKAGPEISARGRVIAVRIPDHLLPDE